jgi:hypothetical protein
LAAQQPPTSTSTAATCDGDCGHGNTRDCCLCLCEIECKGDWLGPLCTSGCTSTCVGGVE